jgi:putative intracellular protease/amidase
MFDLASDPISLALIQSFASAKKPVSAVCHGPVALLNATTPGGEPLIKGAEVTGFSNDEENQVGMMPLMPFALETELNKVSGGKFVKAAQAWEEKVVVSKTNALGGPLITGQNPASATGVALELLKALGL